MKDIDDLLNKCGCFWFLVGVVFGAGGLFWIMNPPSHMDDSTGTEAEQGLEVSPTDGAVKYTIVVSDAVYAYIDGEQVDLAYLQEQIEVKADGKLGWQTTKRVLDYNRMEIGYIQREISK